MHTYLIRFITSLLFIASLLGGFVAIFAPSNISPSKLDNLFNDEYKIISYDNYIDYFPRPKIVFKNVIIRKGQDNIVDAKNLSVNLGFTGIIKLITNNIKKQDINSVVISDGYVVIDDLHKFTNTQGLIDTIYLDNTSITTSYLYKASYIDDNDFIQHYDLGRTDLTIKNEGNSSYSFYGKFLNKNLEIEGKYKDHLEFSIKGQKVSLNVKSTDQNYANVSINVTDLTDINSTIFESFPAYIKDNIDAENINFDGVYDYAKGRFKSFKVSGSILNGQAEEYDYNGQNILLVRLSDLNWGKSINTLGDSFISQLILNFDTKNTSGMIISSENVKLHGQDFGKMQGLIIKNSNFLKIQDFVIGDNKSMDYLSISMLFDDNKDIVSGMVKSSLQKNRKIAKDIFQYMTSYRSNFTFAKDLPVNIEFGFDIGKEYTKIHNLNIDYDQVKISGPIDIKSIGNFQNQYSFNNIISNLDLKYMGLSKELDAIIEDFLYTPIEMPQKTLNSIRNFDKVIDFNLSFNNLFLSENPIDRLSVNGRIAKNFVEIKELKLQDDKANFSSNIVLLANSLRPRFGMKIDGQYLSTEILKFLEPSSKENLVNKNIWSNIPFENIKWEKFDGAISISLKGAKTNFLDFEDLTTLINLSDGKAQIKNLNARLFGGAIKLDGVVASPFNNINASFAIENADFDLLDISGNKLFSSLSGPFSASGKFSTKGNSPAQLISFLKGNIDLASTNTIINGIDIDMIASNINKYKNNISKDILNYLAKSSVSSGKTIAKEVKTKFDIANGSIKSSNFNFDTSLTRGYMRLSYNLLTGAIDQTDINSNFAIPSNAGPFNIILKFSGDMYNIKKEIEFPNYK